MIEQIINNIKYRLDEETQTAEVIAKRKGYEGDIIIPETVVFKKVSYLVTNIDEHAFYNCKSLTSITIPDSVTSIGERAFENCVSITSIVIPDGVTTIGEATFDCCSSLTTVVIFDGVTSIEWWAFCGCKSLTDITFQGTIAQWNKIKLKDNWKDEVPATVVHCTDGDVEM